MIKGKKTDMSLKIDILKICTKNVKCSPSQESENSNYFLKIE